MPNNELPGFFCKSSCSTGFGRVHDYCLLGLLGFYVFRKKTDRKPNHNP